MHTEYAYIYILFIIIFLFLFFDVEYSRVLVGEVRLETRITYLGIPLLHTMYQSSYSRVLY